MNKVRTPGRPRNRRRRAIALAAVALMSSVLPSCTTGASRNVLGDSFFGMHVNRLGADQNPTPWPQGPVGALRLWDSGTTWAAIQPTPTTWNFARLDAQVDAARAHDAEVLLVLGQTPAWASQRPTAPSHYGPGASAEPRNMPIWTQYVAAVAQRYRGRIAAYEVWNEPVEKTYYSGTPEILGRMTVAAATTIKGIDPGARLVSAAPYAFAPRNTWFRAYLANGAGAASDVIGIHLYDGNPERAVESYQSMRQALRDLGLDRKPVWVTETGYHQKGNVAIASPDQRGLVIRTFLLLAGQGISRVYWYAWDNQSWVSVRMTGSDLRTVSPAGLAFRQTYDLLEGASVLDCVSERIGLSHCTVLRDGATRILYWTTAGRVAFPLPPRTTGLQPVGGRWSPAFAGRYATAGVEPVQVTIAK